MSAIFPTTPAEVNLHHLPSNADFISYEFRNDLLWLKAWMPAGIKKMNIYISENRQHDNFYTHNCTGCDRNSADYYRSNYQGYFGSLFYLEFKNSELRDELYEKECCVPFRGFQGQECNKGINFNLVPEINQMEVQNMVFEIGLTYLGNAPRFKKAADNAHLQAGYFEEYTGEIWVTRSYSSPNVYSYSSNEYNNGNICWGSAGRNFQNRYNLPDSLRNISTLYFGSHSNNDLLRLDVFQDYNDQLKEHIKSNSFNLCHNNKFICSGYDSLMLIDADIDVQAFFTMLMAGFKPLPEAPHIMIVPLKNCTIEREGNFYFGYSTQEDSVGRTWYVSSEGYLIGQLDESYSYV